MVNRSEPLTVALTLRSRVSLPSPAYAREHSITTLSTVLFCVVYASPAKSRLSSGSHDLRAEVSLPRLKSSAIKASTHQQVRFKSLIENLRCVERKETTMNYHDDGRTHRRHRAELKRTACLPKDRLVNPPVLWLHHDAGQPHGYLDLMRGRTTTPSRANARPAARRSWLRKQRAR